MTHFWYWYFYNFRVQEFLCPWQREQQLIGTWIMNFWLINSNVQFLRTSAFYPTGKSIYQKSFPFIIANLSMKLSCFQDIYESWVILKPWKLLDWVFQWHRRQNFWCGMLGAHFLRDWWDSWNVHLSKLCGALCSIGYGNEK